MPKWIERLAMNFPVFHLLTIGLAAGGLLFVPSLAGMLLLFFVIYLMPLLIWRLLSRFYPIEQGISKLGLGVQSGNSWLVAHRLQYLFITFAGFEKILILVPGAFSFWLRLWGSKIGKRVMWTPRVDIVDRTHLNIGSYAFIGDHTYMASHFIKRKSGALYLVVKEVKIEERALLGYGCVLGPGAVVPSTETLPALSQALFGRINRGPEWK